MITIYEAYVDDKLKFASIDKGEREEYCRVLYDATGKLADLDESYREPVDHRKKKK